MAMWMKISHENVGRKSDDSMKMNQPTKSEELFKKYCADQSYPVEKIPEGVDKTPDFLVTTPHGQIIAEVKETCPNDEDIKIVSERGGTIKKTIGKRVGEKIKQGKRKKYFDTQIPRVIVLCDNIIVNGERPSYPNFHFSQEYIAFGMYGELKTTILYDKNGGKIVEPRNELGKNQYLRSDYGREISAVCLLCDVLENQPPFVYSFHSVFALLPLSRQIFAGSNDKHFRNPVIGNTFETSWIKF
jgi:hypothetical protein